MARDLGAEIDNLPDEERQAIERRADEIEREIATLRDLRRLAEKSQSEVARALGTSQPAVSRMEHGADMFLSTLRGYVQSLGGELGLVVRMPGQPDIRLDRLSDLHERDRQADEKTG